jgi:hypothetical protein
MRAFTHGILLAAVLALPAELPLPAQTAPSSSSGQIKAGASGSITPDHGVVLSATGKPKKALDDALTPETRQTLLDAMNSSTPTGKPAASHEIILGPGDAAKVGDSKAEKVSYKSLPAPVKNALANGVQGNLNGGTNSK